MSARDPRLSSPAELTLAAQFAALDGALRDADRQAAFADFAERGLPTRRIEAWHYTDLRAAMDRAAPPAATPDATTIAAAGARLNARERLGACRLVFVNGRYAQAIADPLPRGVTVRASAQFAAAPFNDPLQALNAALAPAGCAIEVAAGVVLEEPIEIVHVAEGLGEGAVFSRIAIALGRGASASFVELFVGADGGTQRHAATTIRVAADAVARHVAWIDDEPRLHVETQTLDLGARARLEAFALVCGGALTRRQLFVSQTGKSAKIALAGLTLASARRHADTTLEVVHAAPGGESREFYRAIVADEAVGVFQGKIMVRRAAQKTDGVMKSQAILLSPRAQMHSKPELEIFADDVACGHGATVGALDPEQVFYLQSRGLPRREAEAMLLEAFGREAIDRVTDPRLAAALGARLAGWLKERA